MNNTQFSVSVIFTVFNAERYIYHSISAALSQDYDNCEVIVVDDGSDDSTGEICSRIKHPRFKYIKSNHLGRARALNLAISSTNCKFIAINDADDLSAPDRIKNTMNAFSSNHGIALISTGYTTVEKFSEKYLQQCDITEKNSKNELITLSPSKLYISNSIVHSTVVYPKVIWEKIGGYSTNLDLCIDYDFFMRAAKFGKIAYLPRVTVQYYKNNDSFFKKKSNAEYHRALKNIKTNARKDLRLPLWLIVFDLLPYFLTFKGFVRRILFRV